MGVGCAPEPAATPPRSGLDPVEREAALFVSVGDAALSAGAEAVAAVVRALPSGVQIRGVPGTRGADPAADAAADALLAFAEDVAGALGQAMSVGVDLAALPSDVASVCFDPARPADDPALAALRDGLRALLDAHPAIDTVALDPLAGARFWEVSCTCTPCDAVDAAAQADRLALLHLLVRDEATLRQRAVWWVHGAPELEALGAPAADPTLPRAAVDAAFAAVADPLLPTRSRSTRGRPGPFAPLDPRLDEGWARRVAGTLDAAVTGYGPTDALLLDPSGLHEQLRRERRKGVAAWFVQVDGDGRSALGTLEEANLVVAARAFREPAVDPLAVLAEFLGERLALGAESAERLADRLGDTARALHLATHPLGLPLRDPQLGTPSSFPLAVLPVEELDAAWAERAAAFADPDAAAMIAAHQWAMEGATATSEALGAIASLEAELAPNDHALLVRRVRTLDLAVRAFGHLALADVTRRGRLGRLDDPRADGWLHGDADALDALADEAEDRVADGTIVDPFPVLPDALRAAAAQLRAEIPAAPPLQRDLPVIFRLRHGFGADRTIYLWGVTPPAVGWVERGELLPAYLDTSDRGEGPATWWTAWTRGIPADTRVTWRACAEREDGLVVCSSDQALVTPP